MSGVWSVVASDYMANLSDELTRAADLKKEVFGPHTSHMDYNVDHELSSNFPPGQPGPLLGLHVST